MNKLRKIPLHYSLAVAHKVINKVRIPKALVQYCHVESWANCREQGLCVVVATNNWDSWHKILVAQQRSSDSILIVTGPNKEFDSQTNHPSDQIWETGRTHFHYNEVDKAVKFIEAIIAEKV